MFDFELNNFNSFQLKLVAKNVTIFKISEPSRTPDWLPCVHMHRTFWKRPRMHGPAHAVCMLSVRQTLLYDTFGGYTSDVKPFENLKILAFFAINFILSKS